jgi:hypothetical protein
MKLEWFSLIIISFPASRIFKHPIYKTVNKPAAIEGIRCSSIIFDAYGSKLTQG